jgi:hypothetical protein
MNVGQVGPAGEVGSAQLTPPAVADLNRMGQLPANWNTSLPANLTAAALYYADMSNVYGVPGVRAAAAYNAGPRRYQNIPAATSYQNSFNTHNAAFTALVNCMRGGS